MNRPSRLRNVVLLGVVLLSALGGLVGIGAVMVESGPEALSSWLWVFVPAVVIAVAAMFVAQSGQQRRRA